MDEKQTILLVDDSDDDRFLLKHACQSADFKFSLQTVSNGQDAISYLKGEAPYANRDKFPLPTVMLLDLKMPKATGFDVLRWLRAQPVLKRLPVIVFSASSRKEDVEQAFELGANSYLVKPGSIAALIAMMCTLRDWLDYNHFPTPQKGGENVEPLSSDPLVADQMTPLPPVPIHPAVNA